MSAYNLAMTTATIEFNPQELIGKINELEKVLLPKAATDSLHKAVFQATRELSSEAEARFTNPVPFTLKSFRYWKPKPVGKEEIEASVYIRDEAFKGNPPAKYLQGVMGGNGGMVYPTRFQRILRRLPDTSSDPNQDALGNQGHILSTGEVMVPTMSPKVRRNKYGNMSPGQYTQILTDLAGGMSSAGLLDFDQMGMRHEKGRLKRKSQNERRKSRGLKPLKRDTYFYMNENMARNRNLSSKTAGIFLKSRTGSLHRIMTQTAMSTVPFKFNFLEIADKSIRDVFLRELNQRLKR
jgi:hypothetical protein